MGLCCALMAAAGLLGACEAEQTATPRDPIQAFPEPDVVGAPDLTSPDAPDTTPARDDAPVTPEDVPPPPDVPEDAPPPPDVPEDVPPELAHDVPDLPDVAPDLGPTDIPPDLGPDLSQEVATDLVEPDPGPDFGPICIPDCTNKVCGPSGCGGTCGSCPADHVCSDGACTLACAASCEGRICGGDGCGGSCGSCAPGTLCLAAGTCGSPPCEANCTNKQCGPDGCGGSCGACAALQSCSAGFCINGPCVPSCNGEHCGADGCGGLCECAHGLACSTLATCESTIGCSDGARDQFISETQWPTVAACKGDFSNVSLRAPRTHQACGDDIGVNCTAPEDLCAPGWHICMRNGLSFDLRFRLNPADCKALPETYVAASDNCSNESDQWPLNPVGCDMEEPFACRSSGSCSAPPACGPTATTQCPHGIWPGQTRCFGLHGGRTDNRGCGNIGTDFSYEGHHGQGYLVGVLCCLD